MKIIRTGKFVVVDLGRVEVLFYGTSPVAFVDCRRQTAGRLEHDVAGGHQVVVDAFVARPALRLEAMDRPGLEETILLALSEPLGSTRSRKKRRRRGHTPSTRSPS